MEQVIYLLVILLIFSAASSIIFRLVFSSRVVDKFIETYLVSLIGNSFGLPSFYMILDGFKNQVLFTFIISFIYSIIFLKIYSFHDLLG